jgi:hypothetical protein
MTMSWLIACLPVMAVSQSNTKEEARELASEQPESAHWGSYTPNLGFKVVDTDKGDMSISIYTYVRYLNQKDLDPTYTNAFGVTQNVKQRQDIQLNKVQIKFLGWIFSQKFRYFLYVWTSNPSQGQGAQVVVAGNLNYTFNSYLTLSAGITSLPGTRSVEGNFPFWLSVDSRQIADEFFRPSYTQGIWARGKITDQLRYLIMLGDNLSVLGVSAAQLDNHLNTLSAALVWEPWDDYGQGWGDFEHHEHPAARFGGHFTHSTEDKQSQPTTDAFENTQIRLSDGSVVFTPNLFGPGITVNQLDVWMTTVDAGVKWHGFALEGEYFWRRLDRFEGPGTVGLPKIFNQGFQLQASAMVIPEVLQAYAGGSRIAGTYGKPWDTRVGINWFPFKNKVLRWNTELLWLERSPVGYTAVPFSVGATGLVFHTNLELAL